MVDAPILVSLNFSFDKSLFLPIKKSPRGRREDL